MSAHLPDPIGADYLKPSQQLCPQCGEALDRIHRRAIDRLVSIFTPVQRYRCRGFSCRWEGNLRITRKDAQSSSLQ